MTARSSSPGVHRLCRLLGIIVALAERPHQRRELAERFGVSERQITNDLAVLRQAGITVDRTPQGYRLAREVFPFPGPVAPGELVSVQGSAVRAARP